jgi:hypothetical protein
LSALSQTNERVDKFSAGYDPLSAFDEEAHAGKFSPAARTRDAIKILQVIGTTRLAASKRSPAWDSELARMQHSDFQMRGQQGKVFKTISATNGQTVPRYPTAGKRIDGIWRASQPP